MQSGFSFLFWGLLVVIVDLTLNQFDILPDGVGYVIVAMGCGRLARHSVRFSIARTLSLVLAGLWVVGLAIQHDLLTPYGIACAVVNCAMIWNLLEGVAQVAEARQRADLAGQARHRRAAYVILMVGTALLPLVARDAGESTPVVLALVAVMIVLVVLILQLIYRAGKELVNDKTPML